MIASKNALRLRKWRRDVKLMLIESKGGKCEDCGYTGHHAAFDFHHPDGEPKKDRSLLMNMRSMDKVIRDAEPLVLLCANCHRIRHSSSVSVEQVFCKDQVAGSSPVSGL